MNKLLITTIFVLECFALPVQYYLLVSSTDMSMWEATVRFFSYFTILTNSLVTICCAALLFSKNSVTLPFFQKNTTLTATTVYILIVGLVYNIILRPLANVDGILRIVSEIFHTVVPTAFLLYWILFVSKQPISWKSAIPWMIYPLSYMVYTLVHGVYSGFYPYPFIDVNKLGYTSVMVNGLLVLLVFVILSAALIAVGRLRTNLGDERKPIEF